MFINADKEGKVTLRINDDKKVRLDVEFNELQKFFGVKTKEQKKRQPELLLEFPTKNKVQKTQEKQVALIEE